LQGKIYFDAFRDMKNAPNQLYDLIKKQESRSNNEMFEDCYREAAEGIGEHTPVGLKKIQNCFGLKGRISSKELIQLLNHETNFQLNFYKEQVRYKIRTKKLLKTFLMIIKICWRTSPNIMLKGISKKLKYGIVNSLILFK
jgi:hypothetical protein